MSDTTYDAFFSGALNSVKQSPIRELQRIARRPGIISFAGGMPDKFVLPVPEFAGGALALGRNGMEVLQYAAPDGYAPLRDQMKGYLEPKLGAEPDERTFMVTCGTTQALDLLCAAVIDPGDAVVIEDPHYPGVAHTLACRGAVVYGAACDGSGVSEAAIADAVKRARADGRRVKFAVVTPTFQNPTGEVMPQARREAIVKLAAELDMLIFESDATSDLRYDGDELPSLFSISSADEHPRVVHGGSFSWLIGPGIRTGWAAGPAPVIEKMIIARQGADMAVSSVTQAVLAQFLSEGRAVSVMNRTIASCRKARDAMAAAIAAKLPKAEFAVPSGGAYIWARLPGKDTNRLFMKAAERGALFVRGAALYTTGGGSEMMRLCFTSVGPRDIEIGMDRIADALKAI